MTAAILRFALAGSASTSANVARVSAARDTHRAIVPDPTDLAGGACGAPRDRGHSALTGIGSMITAGARAERVVQS